MLTPVILIIEDNNTTRRLYKIGLESENYTVLEASDGKTALKLAKKNKIDLILQDLILPDIDGLELNRQLRTLPNIKNIPILALSGFLSKMEEFQKKGAQFNTYLIKPIEIVKLINVIKIFLPSSLSIVKQEKNLKRVLIADDNLVQLKLMRMQFLNAGFEVDIAKDGKEALEKIKNKPPDIVISDVLMPYFDGFELCHEIRRNSSIAHIPVILITSNYLEEADRTLAKKVGADVYLTRTSDITVLICIVNKCIQHSPKQKIITLDEFEEKHSDRLISQLEHQLLINTNLSRRCAMQTAQLSLLSGVAEALTDSNGIEDALKNVLATCLDSAGISKGILYFVDNKGELNPTQILGYKKSDEKLIKHFFGQDKILKDSFIKKEIMQFPSEDIPDYINEFLLKNADFKTALLIPLISDKQCLGLLFMGSKVTDVTAEDPLAFARTLGAQIGQAVGLTKLFHNIKTSENRYKVLMDNASCAIIIVNCKGIFTELNKQGEKLFDANRDKIISKSFKDIVFLDDLNMANKVFHETLEKAVLDLMKYA